jgi:hypothetical protein
MDVRPKNIYIKNDHYLRLYLGESNEVAWAMSDMRIGIELDHKKLRHDLRWHPERYFFILLADSHASLCIRTCDATGEDIKMHIIDGLSLDADGSLYSVFACLIDNAICRRSNEERGSIQMSEFPLTPSLILKISKMPDLIDWMMNSIITKKRNLVMNYGFTQCLSEVG